MKNANYIYITFFAAIVLVYLICPELVFANKLEQAAEQSKSIIYTVAQILAPIGVVAGGALMAIGNSEAGRRVMTGGIIGSALVYGGPALVDLIKSIFS